MTGRFMSEVSFCTYATTTGVKACLQLRKPRSVAAAWCVLTLFASHGFGDVSTPEDREALFEYLITKTLEREAFSEIKNRKLGLDVEAAMRAYRDEVIQAETDQELFYALVKMSNARRDRHLRVNLVELLPIRSTRGGHAEKQILVCKIKGLKATGHVSPTGFVVLKGSHAVLKERASAKNNPYILATRKRLTEDGTLVEDGGHLKFTRDAGFGSPSAAATVVQGGSANGLLAWRSKGGKTLKELEAP